MDCSRPDKPDTEMAKRIVCALIAEAGGTFEGKTRLNKAFWWAHVHYYKNHRGLLSRYPIARLPEGPAIDDADDLLVALEREGRIDMGQRELRGNFEPLGVYTLKQKPSGLSEEALDSIRNASQWIRNKPGGQASKESHRLSRGWNTARNGQILDIALDALTDDEFAQMEGGLAKIDHSIERARTMLQKALGG